MRPLDLDSVLAQTVERWSAVAERVWVLQADAGTALGVEERLRALLDTLVENAIRYTTPSDTIRLFGRHDPVTATVTVGVADSGPGLSPALLEALNRSADAAQPLPTTRDALSQTGLGLGLVLDIASRRGGVVRAERAPRGGAMIAFVSPVGRAHPQPPPAATHAIAPRRPRRLWSGRLASTGAEAPAPLPCHGTLPRRR